MESPDPALTVIAAWALGRMGSATALPALRLAFRKLLNILYIDSYPQSRREMGLSLARLLDSEGKYIELSRRLEEDPGTHLPRRWKA